MPILSQKNILWGIWGRRTGVDDQQFVGHRYWKTQAKKALFVKHHSHNQTHKDCDKRCCCQTSVKSYSRYFQHFPRIEGEIGRGAQGYIY